MAINSEYRVNEDGSVTKIYNGSNNTENNRKPGGSSNNNGCIWLGIIVIVIGVLIAIFAAHSSDSSYTNEDADSTVESVDSVAEEEPEVEEVYTPSTTYLNVSDDDIYMSADGGSTEISISTDGEWYIDVDVTSWGHLTKSSNSVTLQLDENNSSSSRTDYFVIKSGNYTKRVNITRVSSSMFSFLTTF